MAPLSHFVNLSICPSIFPNAWKSAVVKPIYKIGEPTDVANFRNIRILPIASEIICNMIKEEHGDFQNTRNVSLHTMQL